MPSKLRKPDGTYATEAQLAVGNAVSATPVTSVTGTIPAGGTGAAAGGFDTAPHRDTFIATVTELKTQFNDLLAKLRTAGLLDT